MTIFKAETVAFQGFHKAMASALLATTALVGAGAILAPAAALAQEARGYDIPAGPLAVALNRFGEAANVELVYDSALTNGVSSPGLKGSFSTAEALSRLLVGTGLTFRPNGAGAFTLERAPQSAAGTVQLGPVRVAGRTGAVSGNYGFGDPIDSGISEITREVIDIRAPGSGDINQMLSILPSVQFSSSQNIASAVELQDIRPEKLSISGGSVYENLFLVDGVGVNSRLDMFGTDPTIYNAAHVSNVVSASPQTVWVDAGLVGKVTVRDSNVSARYGQFGGGVVEIDTRRPARRFGVSGYYAESSDGTAVFRMSDLTKDALGANAPPKPDYLKQRYGVSVDLPVSEDFRILGAYNRSTASVTNLPGTSYAHLGSYRQDSISENWMLKGEYDLSPSLRFETQFTYSPYESEFRTNNAIEGEIVSQGGGWTGQAGLKGDTGKANWELTFTHAFSDNDRDGPAGTFNISTAAPNMGWCSTGSSCTIGSVGPLSQRQYDTGLKGEWSQPLGAGRISTGFEYAHVVGSKSRSEDIPLHLNANVNSGTVCLNEEGYACVNGAYALSRRNILPAFDARAAINSYSLWAEYDVDVAGFRVRAGLRLDHEDFLGNYNFAPRASVSRDLPLGLNLTLGLNRYYGRSFLGYALREQFAVTKTYDRVPTIVGTRRIWSDNWVLTAHTNSSRYSNIGLETPYVDELALALRGNVPVIGGEFRVKGVLRQSRDQFASSLAQSEGIIKDTGQQATRSVYTITNDGRRDYKGLTLEYLRNFGSDHRLSVNASISKTEATNISYFDVAEDIEGDGKMVYYNGAVVPLLEAVAANQVQDYANPLVVNADLTSRWFDGRLSTNINARYRDGYSRVEDTDVNIVVGGTRYDVFDTVRYKKTVEVNFGANLEVIRTGLGVAAIEVRANNLFNTISNRNYVSTSQPWQMGRNFWLTLRLTH